MNNKIALEKLAQANELLDNGNLIEAFAIRQRVYGGSEEVIKAITAFDRKFEAAYIKTYTRTNEG